ncbi:MAG TPA: 50S ribosomal protein L13 [Smithellaceae bacterium]|nr:50S ribosomal protein L13 [Smithellaceae bacterium]HQF84047.1 50S ribosomal protein L13 [Smithellaceae bacterium]HQG80356.1 50S ribosomal protein L13 [Smithellaceae bacterium]
MKTFSPKEKEVKKDWFVVDASGKALGRLASEIAARLRGKHKAIYAPHVDTGDFIVVVNAEKVTLSGKKLTDKIYYSHSGYPGGLKEKTAGKILADKPEYLIHTAVAGMLPKNSLGRKMLRKLKVYSGNAHPHEAQCPQAWAM